MLDRFTNGDTWAQTDTLADYPASAGWVLHTRFLFDAGSTPIDLTSAASGDDHVTSVDAADTADWQSGTATWVQWVVLDDVSISVGKGKITLLADPRAATGALDLRTDAQVALDNVRAMLRGTTAKGVLRYTIGGRMLERYSIKELLQLEAKFVADVKRETQAEAIAAGGVDSRKIYVRQTRA